MKVVVVLVILGAIGAWAAVEVGVSLIGVAVKSVWEFAVATIGAVAAGLSILTWIGSRAHKPDDPRAELVRRPNSDTGARCRCPRCAARLRLVKRS